MHEIGQVNVPHFGAIRAGARATARFTFSFPQHRFFAKPAKAAGPVLLVFIAAVAELTQSVEADRSYRRSVRIWFSAFAVARGFRRRNTRWSGKLQSKTST